MKTMVKKYWWLGLLLIPIGMLLASLRIRRVRTINFTDFKGNKLSVKGTVKRNESNSGYIIDGILLKSSDPDFVIGRKITTEFLDMDMI